MLKNTELILKIFLLQSLGLRLYDYYLPWQQKTTGRSITWKIDMSDLEKLRYYLGIEVDQGDGYIELKQSGYAIFFRKSWDERL